jgi:CrcB protein
VVRYLVGTAITTRFASRFPFGTFAINVTGSFLIGLAMTLLTERFAPHPNWRLLIVVGFLGGYTTFSSFEYETFQSARSGGHLLALGYVVASVALGYLGVWMGVLVAGKRQETACYLRDPRKRSRSTSTRMPGITTDRCTRQCSSFCGITRSPGARPPGRSPVSDPVA